MLQKVMFRLEEWALVVKSPYSSPEMGMSFQGLVYGHPRFKDGHPVTTSPIVSFDGESFLTHSGSRYILGEVSSEYEKMFPNALNRVMESIGKIK